MPGPGNVGERVRNLRLTRRLSQAQLAGHDLSDSYISLIESGKRTPTPAVVRMLAERLGCTAEYLADGIEPEQRAHLEVRERLAELARLNGDPEASLATLEEVLARSDDPELTVRARWSRAQALADLGRVEDAIAAFEEIREHSERDAGQGCWLPAVIALADCYHLVGDLGQAIALGERALFRLNELGLASGPEHAEVARVLMLAYVDRSDLERARDLGRRILAGTAPAPAYQLASIGALDSGAVGEALYFAQRAVESHGMSTTPRGVARLNVAAARALLRGVTTYGSQQSAAGADAGSAQEALDLLNIAAPDLTGADALECTIETARALVMVGRIDRAVEIAQQALAEASAELPAAQARLILARAALARRDRAEALSLLRTTESDLARLPALRSVAHAFRELGDLFDAAGDSAGATTAYRRALQATGLRIPGGQPAGRQAVPSARASQGTAVNLAG